MNKLFKSNCSIQFKHSVLLALMSSMFNFTYAQQEKKTVIEGNKNYESKKYNEAEKDYKKAIQQNKNSYTGAFNLGNTYYKQGKYEDAANQFQSITHTPVEKDTLAKVYHNLGNSLLKQRKFEESINAYKNALKNNSYDEETRYNMSYAQKMLKQQQQNKNNKEDKNKDKKDDKKNKDNKKEDKEKEKKDNRKHEQQQQNQISKEDAQRLLDALQNDEKNIQDKVKKERARGVKVQIEKDW